MKSSHSIAVLALDSVEPIDLAIPLHVFASRPTTRYRVTVCGDVEDGRNVVTTALGFTFGKIAPLDCIRSADTLIVPGYRDYLRPPSAPAIAMLEEASRIGVRIASICTGAFALAAAGLLADRSATTHWARADELALLHPNVNVNRDVLYIDDGDILTSAGVTAGIDLCLHIVRRDLGAAVANEIARELVAAPHRDGGQTQYIARPVPEDGGTSLAATRQWALENLREDLTVAQLAAYASVSRRTLSRIWREETGDSPHQWLLRARINQARELLETTTLSVEQIARDTGLGSATNLRARFRVFVGTTPGAYRRTFASHAA